MADTPYAAVRRYVNAFNAADVDAMAAECAEPMQILDGMAPHVWQGPTATEDWWRDVQTEGELLGASGYQIALGAPRHLDVTGDCCYVVVPATMTFTVAGAQRTQDGSTYTVALRKIDDRWHLSAWSWSKGD
jgi:ketosteroid isomerase-like protein